jgi:hypothetical protein
VAASGGDISARKMMRVIAKGRGNRDWCVARHCLFAVKRVILFRRRQVFARRSTLLPI